MVTLMHRDYFGIDLDAQEEPTEPELDDSDIPPELAVLEEYLFYGMTKERLENLSNREVAGLMSVGWF